MFQQFPVLRNEGLCSPKDMYVNAHGRSIHNRPKESTTHMSTHSRTDQRCHSHTLEYYTTMKKNEVWLTAATWVNLTDKTISREPFLRIHTVGLHLRELVDQIKGARGKKGSGGRRGEGTNQAKPGIRGAGRALGAGGGKGTSLAHFVDMNTGSGSDRAGCESKHLHLIDMGPWAT